MMLTAVDRSHRYTHPYTARRIVTLLTIAGLVALVLGLGATMANPAPAEAAAKVSVSGTPALEGESTLELSGTGFQSVQNGFGGIYVLFGWVDDPSGGGWRPSAGGATGTNYRYVYDDETNPTGYQLFVTFPGSSTAYAANGGEIADNGSWKATIRIPGAKFTSYDRAQNEKQVDCTQVQCGIITIGAHGVTNANNESFTPVDFAAGGADDSGSGGEQVEAASGESGAPESTEDDPAANEDTAPAADTTSGGTNDTGGGQTPAEADPAVAPVSSQPLLSTSWAIFFAILAGVAVIGVIIAVGLGFGIGGYLAAKSLLLGVSPAALEKERDRRERKGIRTRHRLERRRLAMQRKKKLRLAKVERSSERALAQTAHRGANPPTGKLPPQVIAFFETEDRRRAEEPGAPGADPEELKDTRVLARVPDDATRETDETPDDKDGDR